MLTIGKGQFDAMMKKELRDFCQRAVDFLIKEHPQRCKERGHDDIASIVNRYASRIVTHGITSAIEVVTILETIVMSKLDVESEVDANLINTAFKVAGPTFDDLHDRIIIALRKSP